MYRLIRKIIIILSCHILYRVKYENEEVLKQLDKCLICPNHSRIYDPIYLYPKVDNMYSMAKSELFKHKIVARFLEYNNAFPIDRERVDAGSLKKAIKLIKTNEKIKLLIFPEGKVIKDKSERGVVKKGPIYISKLAGVPIIPVYITARPRYFSKVIVKFGEPIYLENRNTKDKELIEKDSKMLMKKIYEMEDDFGDGGKNHLAKKKA